MRINKAWQGNKAPCHANEPYARQMTIALVCGGCDDTGSQLPGLI